MRKKIFLSIIFLLMLAFVGCTAKNDVKIYEGTEESGVSHTEVSITAVILNINTEQKLVQFKDCRTGVEHNLLSHGGVKITNSRDKNVSFTDLGVGSVVDVVYYEDTAKLVSVKENKSTSTISNVKKFSANKQAGKATYKGISCKLSEHAVAINHDGKILDISEVSTEDKVTLHMFGSKLVAVVIDEGHGYVRLSNQETYVGGLVEIGYDVIVPVTENMLLTVREGEYTLRINNRGFSETKDIVVKKDTETVVDLGDIAIPKGTAVFEITPADATLYIGGEEIDGRTYTDLYGTYSVKVEADDYKTYRGSIKIDDTVNSFTIKLAEDKEDTEDTEDTEKTDKDTTKTTTEKSTTEKPNKKPDASPSDATEKTTEEEPIIIEDPEDPSVEKPTYTTSEDQGEEKTDDITTEKQDGENGSSEGVETDNLITINTPALAGVYVDGDYVGDAPISIQKVTGTHTVTLYRSGYLIKSYTIEAEDNGKDDVYNFAELQTLLDLVE